MSKMKNKLFGSVTAVTLSMAMALSMSSAVFAAASVTGTSSSSGDVTLQEDAASRTTTNAENKTSSAYTGDTKSVYVEIDNNTKYTISIPKVITLLNREASGKNDFSFDVNADLAPTQTLTVSVSDVTLKNQRGTGDAELSLTSNLKSSTETGVTMNSRSVQFGTGTAGTGANQQGFYTESNITIEGTLENVKRLNAGRWRGVLTFTAKLNTAETDGSGTGSDLGE